MDSQSFCNSVLAVGEVKKSPVVFHPALTTHQTTRDNQTQKNWLECISVTLGSRVCLLFARMRLLVLSHKTSFNLLNLDLDRVLSLQQSVWFRTSCTLIGMEAFTKPILLHPLGWHDTPEICSFIPHLKSSSVNTQIAFSGITETVETK